MRAKRTLYNPEPGSAFLITNVKTGVKIKASILTYRDVAQIPVRSSYTTKEGDEFFKMKSGDSKNGFSYYKFKNSSLYKLCLSDDDLWEFTGEKVNGLSLKKISDIVKKKKIKDKEEEDLDVIDNIVRWKIEKIDETVLNTITEDDIKEKISSVLENDFIDLSCLNNLQDKVNG